MYSLASGVPADATATAIAALDPGSEECAASLGGYGRCGGHGDGRCCRTYGQPTRYARANAPTTPDGTAILLWATTTTKSKSELRRDATFWASNIPALHSSYCRVWFPEQSDRFIGKYPNAQCPTDPATVTPILA